MRITVPVLLGAVRPELLSQSLQDYGMAVLPRMSLLRFKRLLRQMPRAGCDYLALTGFEWRGSFAVFTAGLNEFMKLAHGPMVDSILDWEVDPKAGTMIQFDFPEHDDPNPSVAMHAHTGIVLADEGQANRSLPA